MRPPELAPVAPVACNVGVAHAEVAQGRIKQGRTKQGRVTRRGPAPLGVGVALHSPAPSLIVGRRWVVALLVGLASGLLGFGLPRSFAADRPGELTVGGVVRVTAPATRRVEPRAWVTLAQDVDPARTYRLVPTRPAQGEPLVAQVQPAAQGEPARLWWVIPGELPPGTIRNWQLEVVAADTSAAPPTTDAAARGVQVEQTPQSISVSLAGQPVLQYHIARVEPPAGIDRRYGRSGHIHPARTPAGRIVTDQFPPDHAHQSGLFFAFTKTEFEGRTPNFWDLHGGTGLVRCREVKRVQGGAVFGEFQVVHEHVDLSGPAEQVALRELWTVRVWNLPQTSRGAFVCDVISRVAAAGSSPLVVKQYHYGGMALRGARGWTIDNSRFVTAEGQGRAAGNHTRPRWCDLAGPVDGETAGLAIMTHPDNLRFPEPLRIHPQMPYMVYSPAQLGDFSISPEAPWTGRYRYVFHDGATDAPLLNSLWEDFAAPLQAVVAE